MGHLSNQRPSHCIFCGNKPLTKEHVWPRWLRSHIPYDKDKFTSVTHDIYLEHVDGSAKKETGDPKSRGIKVVCAACNSGWMSRLQEAVKPDLLNVILAEPAVFGQAKQARLAAWCAMTAMTGEFLSKSDVVGISQQDRDYLKDKLSPPRRTWKIWMGKYGKGEWGDHRVQNLLPIVDEDSGISPNADNAPNTQTTSFVIGQLYVHLISSPILDLIRRIEFRPRYGQFLTQIWPLKSAIVHWPPANAISDDDAEGIAYAFAHHFDAAGRLENGLPPRHPF